MANEKTGSDQSFVWATTGAYAAAGFVTGGSGPQATYDNRERTGINREQLNRDGLIDFGGSVEIALTPDGKDLLTAILVPTAEVYDVLKFGGNLGDGFVEHTPAYVQKASLKIAVGGPATLSLDWMALEEGVGVPTAVDVSDTWNFEEYETTTTIGGESLGVQSVTYNWEFAVVRADDCDGRTAGSKRTHRALIHKGLQKEEVAIDVLVPPTIDPLADYPASNKTVQTVLVNNAAAPITLTIAVPNLKFSPPPVAAYKPGRGDLVVWTGTLVPRSLKASAPTCT